MGSDQYHCVYLVGAWHLFGRQMDPAVHEGGWTMCSPHIWSDPKTPYMRRIPDCPKCINIIKKAVPKAAVVELPELRDEVKQASGVEPTVWTCPCSCGTKAVYARGNGALWVATHLTYGLGPRVRITALDDARSTRDFLAVLGTMVNKETIQALRDELRKEG